MSCSCTEDFEIIGNVKIGRNKVKCQECIDADALQEKEVLRRDIMVQLNALDLKAIRPLMEGDTVRIADLNAQKAVLRAQLNAI